MKPQSGTGLRLVLRESSLIKTFSSDLNEIDTLVGKGAKWEKELYDITRPDEA